MLQKRGLVVIRTAPDDGRTHAISLTARGRAVHDKVFAAAIERETPAVVVPEERGTRSADRHAEAAARDISAP